MMSPQPHPPTLAPSVGPVIAGDAAGTKKHNNNNTITTSLNTDILLCTVSSIIVAD